MSENNVIFEKGKNKVSDEIKQLFRKFGVNPKIDEILVKRIEDYIFHNYVRKEEVRKAIYEYYPEGMWISNKKLLERLGIGEGKNG